MRPNTTFNPFVGPLTRGMVIALAGAVIVAAFAKKRHLADFSE